MMPIAFAHQPLHTVAVHGIGETFFGYVEHHTQGKGLRFNFAPGNFYGQRGNACAFFKKKSD